MSSTLLHVRAISLAGRLDPTGLAVEAGTMTAIIGPNGSGKTSLLRALARIDRPGGQVTLDGRDLDLQSPAWRARMLGYLPAGRDMAWAIPVRDLLSLGDLTLDPARLNDIVEQLELKPLLERTVDRLSTGERSRVLIGHLLAAAPRLLLLDEPLSHLDPYWVLTVLGLLRASAQAGSAVLLSLHDLHQLGRCDRVLLMDQRQIAADGSPTEILASPLFESIFRIEASAVNGR